MQSTTGPHGALNEFDPIRRVVLHHARDCYASQQRLDTCWESDAFAGCPDFREALAQYERFVESLECPGMAIDFVARHADDRISAIYCRDSSIVCRAGIILCNMRNHCRKDEPGVMAAHFKACGIPVAGAIAGPGLLEGGDFIWLDEHACAVANGYRTNAEGIRQLSTLLGPRVHVEVVALPHHRGPDECLHLMSIISPLDADLALVFSPLMPVTFRDWLRERGIELVEVPQAEFEPSMGCNVLALAPRRCLVIDGNLETRRRLEAAGCETIAYPGSEISIKGGGGPTCLTRPLVRWP